MIPSSNFTAVPGATKLVNVTSTASWVQFIGNAADARDMMVRNVGSNNIAVHLGTGGAGITAAVYPVASSGNSAATTNDGDQIFQPGEVFNLGKYGQDTASIICAAGLTSVVSLTPGAGN